MERTNRPLLPVKKFYWRLAKFGISALLLATVSLVIGMLGYRYFENQSWPEAFVNAAMLLGAMGPVTEPNSDAGMIFAGCYALYCGLVYLFMPVCLSQPWHIVCCIIFTPILVNPLMNANLKCDQCCSALGQRPEILR